MSLSLQFVQFETTCADDVFAGAIGGVCVIRPTFDEVQQLATKSLFLMESLYGRFYFLNDIRE